MSATAILVVGLGKGAAWAREIRKAPNLELAGLVDVDQAKLDAIGDEAGVPANRRYHDYETALTEAGAEIVVLAVPTPLHCQMSLAGLRAGHHVIVEKPLAMSLADSRELRQELKRYDRRFMVSEQYRFADGMENLRRAVAGGLIGRLAYIHHEFYKGAQNEPGRWEQAGHWSQAYQIQGLHDMSIHHFDMWYYLSGEPVREIHVKPIDVGWKAFAGEFGFSAWATLGNGTHVSYISSRALARPQTPWHGTLWVVGEKGALYWDGDGAQVRLSRLAPTPGNPEALASEPVAYVNRGVSSTNTTLIAGVRAFLAAISEGRPHPNNIDDNWNSFATAMAAVESAKAGKPVEVEKE